MSKILDNLLALAQSQVGYTEKDNDNDLDTKVGSTAGTGNHTKYACDLITMGLWGYCGSAWCAVYQMWLEVKTVSMEQALKNMGTKFYNCFAIRDYAKSQGQWLSADKPPKVGYLVIFKQSHIARVIRVSSSKIYTNEGNIVGEEKNGSIKWGKLKNGDGYISLTYTQNVNVTDSDTWKEVI